MDSEIDDEISDELKAELDRRYAAYEKNPREGVTWEELKERLLSKRARMLLDSESAQ